MLRLRLDLGVELGAQQDDVGADPEPGQQHDHPAQRAERLLVRAEVAHVDRERDRGQEPQDHRDPGARRHPSPLRVVARRPVAVEDRQTPDRDRRDDRPAQEGRDRLREAPDRQELQHDRQHDDERHRHEEPRDHAERQRQPHEGAVEEAARLLLVIGDVQPLHRG